MYLNLNKRWWVIIFVIISISLCNCSNKQIDQSVSSILIDKINHEKDGYTSLFLLSHISLSDADVKNIINYYNEETNLTKKLHIVYVLAARTQENKYIDEFIELYPSGANQAIVWNTSRDSSDYICVSSPLQNRLAIYAMSNDKALSKLIEGSKYADGADKESLIENIYKIYERFPEKVLRELKTNNINLSMYGIK